jgi:hypothetical protein
MPIKISGMNIVHVGIIGNMYLSENMPGILTRQVLGLIIGGILGPDE